MERLNKKYKFNILTNDPSITAWGWAIVTFDGRILDSGCIKTKTDGKKRRIRKSDENTQRIREINLTLLELIRKYEVKYIISELQHGSQNASAAVFQGAVTAIVQTIGDTLDIGVEWYSEGDSKKCALGKISAEKSEMIARMKQVFPNYHFTGIKYIDEAVADALAVYYCATKNSSTLKLLKYQ